MLKYSIFVFLLHSTLSQTTDKYSDEDRPYKFGFNIQGYQHRQEEKNEKGIIMGEYGFITADGYYRVTVYATDENGDFKILSMKNYYVGFPPEDPTTTPGPSGRTGPGPAKLSFGNQPASPGTSQGGGPGSSGVQTTKPFTRPQGLAACSDCSIPTTTARPNLLGGGVGGFGGAGKSGGFGGAGGSGSGGFGGAGVSGNGGFGGAGVSGSGGFGGAGGSGSGGFGGARGSGSGGFGGAGGSGSGGFGGAGGNRPGFGGQGPQSGISGQEPAGGIGGSFGSSPRGGQGGLGVGGSFGQGPLGGSPQSGSGGFGGQSPQGGVRPNIPQSGGPGLGFGGNQGSRPGSSDPNFPRGPNNFNQPNGAPGRRPQIGEVRDGLPPGVTLNDIKDLLYTFNYTVGFHGHHEDGYRNGDKEGDYFFDGRDGVERKVEYLANEFGFQPNITLIDLPENDVRRPKEETEKEYGLKGYEFKWFYRR